MATQPNQQLFTEMFRPQTLEQAVIVPRIKEELERGLTSHVLLYGKPGSGKTTLTKIMAKQFKDPLFINASLERGIDIIRDKVERYASSASLWGGHEEMKLVILEECDNMTRDAWLSLRALMDQFHKSCRFIANCNYIDKLDDAIQSRFTCIPIEPINQEEESFLLAGYIQRAKLILNKCQITYDDAIVEKFVRADFPNMRNIIKKIQQLYMRGIHELNESSLGASFDGNDLFELILNPGNPWDNYKMLSANWAAKADDAMLIIGQQFPIYLQQMHPNKLAKLPLIVLAIAEYDAQLPNAIDKFIVLLALVYKLQMVLKD